MMRLTFCTAVLGLSLIVTLSAARPLVEVATVPFSMLVQESDLIVVARVGSVTNRFFGARIAKATPLTSWKGQPDEEIEFLASPTWTCDISKAIPGETVLLFLEVSKEGRLTIAHSGRGRMPLIKLDTQEFATFFGDIRFPEGTVRAIAVSADRPYRHGVELSRMEQLVKDALEEARKAEAERGAK